MEGLEIATLVGVIGLVVAVIVLANRVATLRKELGYEPVQQVVAALESAATTLKSKELTTRLEEIERDLRHSLVDSGIIQEKVAKARSTMLRIDNHATKLAIAFALFGGLIAVAAAFLTTWIQDSGSIHAWGTLHALVEILGFMVVLVIFAFGIKRVFSGKSEEEEAAGAGTYTSS